MTTAFSIRAPLQGELADFIRSSGFSCAHTEGLVRDLTCLLASYHEEGVPLFPEVFILPALESVVSLSPGTQRLTVGSITLDDDAAEKILKNCATLAAHGWAIFVAKTGTDSAEFGVFRSLRNPFATSAEEAMAAGDQQSPALLMRNRGKLVVELRNSKDETFTASFTSATPKESSFARDVATFAAAASDALESEEGKIFRPYLARFLTDVLQRCHGTLLAAHVPPRDGPVPLALRDGLWLSEPIDFVGAHRAAVAAKDADSLSALQAAEALVAGMIHSDGVVVFGTNGAVLGYRIFLKATDEEKKTLPDKGGGRRRT